MCAGIFTAGFVIMLIFLDYEKGWNWETLEYAGFWTADGMIRHLFFNGFHPVFPWTAFLLAGLWLGRQDLSNPTLRKRILLISAGVVAVTELVSYLLLQGFRQGATSAEIEIVEALLGTAPMPPMPFYLLAGGGTAMIVIVLSIIVTDQQKGGPWKDRMKAVDADGEYAVGLKRRIKQIYDHEFHEEHEEKYELTTD